MAPPAVIDSLEPASLWGFFYDLTQIPRPSYHEDRVIAYLKDFAAQRGLEFVEDSAHNVVIRRPGSGGGENAPWVVIQGHIDMVCEKNSDVVHDFHKDPLKLKRAGDWLKAEGTTLGADNGIGVATALTLLDAPKSQKLPPLEGLFTVAEEVGMDGALGIDPTILKGRTLLNLDTEDYGEIFIGCAGGGDMKFELDCETEKPPANSVVYELKVSGLLGGHSGLNIHEGRGNAVQLCAQLLNRLRAVPGVRLVSIKGGDKRNAIARECAATVLMPADSVLEAENVVDATWDAMRSQYLHVEPDMKLVFAEGSPVQPLTMCVVAPDTLRLFTLLLGLPHGAHKFSQVAKGVVETSNNVASVSQLASGEAGAAAARVARYQVVTSTRSLIDGALELYRDRLELVGKMCGAKVTREAAYPGWAPDANSQLLKVTRDVFESITGKVPAVKVIHAGLECGLLGKKFPGMDMVSYGPTIRAAHSPDERVDVTTVKPFFDITLRLLEQLADVRA